MTVSASQFSLLTSSYI